MKKQAITSIMDFLKTMKGLQDDTLKAGTLTQAVLLLKHSDGFSINNPEIILVPAGVNIFMVHKNPMPLQLEFIEDLNPVSVSLISAEHVSRLFLHSQNISLLLQE